MLDIRWSISRIGYRIYTNFLKRVFRMLWIESYYNDVRFEG